MRSFYTKYIKFYRIKEAPYFPNGRVTDYIKINNVIDFFNIKRITRDNLVYTCDETGVWACLAISTPRRSIELYYNTLYGQRV